MQWLNEHRVGIILLTIVVGGIALAFTQSNTNDTTSSAASEIASVRWADGMARGSEAAKVSLIQYSDFLCPSCSYVSTQVMPQLDKEFIDSGDVAVEFRPMAFIAEGSTVAGMGAFCAVDQKQFWPYHDGVYQYVAEKIFTDGKDPKQDTILTSDIVKDLAAKAGLAADEFNTCLDSGKHQDDITNTTQAAFQAGITGTPYILVDGQHITGNPDLATIRAMIKASL